MKSESLKLSKEMIALLAQRGITEPTPIQKEIIPAIFEGRDVIAQSETGSGKTLSFAIPIIERMNRADGLRALVICPTRELAVQIAQEFVKFSHGKHLGVTPIYGGVSIGEQARRIARTNIAVGTPGRLIDLLERGALKLDTITTLVLDEADRMLDMGFIKDIETIIHKTPKERQTMLFSATLAKEIVTLSRKFLKDPKHVQMAASVKPELLHQTYYQTTPDQKIHLLVHLMKAERDLTLVFCNRKHITAKIAKQLSRAGIAAKCLNGDMSQSQRERTTADFKAKKFNVLVATDVAARGLHIDDISHVYNYEIPRDVETYTHRVGRTARAGNKGEAISLVATGEERGFFQRVLFTYKGSIVLRGANDVGFAKVNVEDMPATETRERGFGHRDSRKGFGSSDRRRERPSNERRGGYPERRTERPFPKRKFGSNDRGDNQRPAGSSNERPGVYVGRHGGSSSEKKIEFYQIKRDRTTRHSSNTSQPTERKVWDKRSFGEMLRRKKKQRLYKGD
jgi:ATP-dependent RNA helicase DeaD